MTIMSRLTVLKSSHLLGPTFIIFLSANIANVANLAFNMIFARLMTPDQFADLTLLITIKLGLLSLFSALQYGISEITARRGAVPARLLASNLVRRSLRVTIPLCLALLWLAEYIANSFNFSDVRALVLLILAIPLFLPLVIYRGLAQGQLSLPKMVGSLQTEWVVRLAGCIALWQAGFGLLGITVALILSVIAGLIFTTDRKDRRVLLMRPSGARDAEVFKTAMPYAVIFLAQIFALDGDIFIAKSILSDEDAGAAAGMLLIQRIFFFAFLSFATVLQPIVAGRNTDDLQAKAVLLRLLLTMFLISFVALSVIAIVPEFFIGFFLGPQYLHLSPLVLLSAIVGVGFMAAQLTTIFLIARGKQKAPFYLLGLVVFQYLLILPRIHFRPEFTYSEFLTAKTIVLMTGAVIFIICALQEKPKAAQT